MMKYCNLILLCSLLLACGDTPKVITLSGSAQGTQYHFSYWVPTELSKKKTINTLQNDLQSQVDKELSKIDLAISNYRSDSTIEKFNTLESVSPTEVPAELVSLIVIAREVNKASSGCYDLTIKPLFDLWGFKSNNFHAPTTDELADALTLIGMDKLVVDDPIHIHKNLAKLRVDMSSIGQGYSVGQIAAIFDANGIHNYLVEIGGEMQVAGTKPDGKSWRLALERPLPAIASEAQQQWQKVMNIHASKPISVMTSGTYRHYFDHDGKRYSHILDARTGKPVEHNTVSVTVFHNSSSYADAWSTAFLCMGREAGVAVADQYGVAVLFIDQTAEGSKEYLSSPLKKLDTIQFIDP